MSAQIIKTACNQAIYTARQENYEHNSASYWQQAIAEYEQQPITLLGFACDQGVQRNQGRIGAKHAPDVIKAAFGKLPISSKLWRAFGDVVLSGGLVADAGNIQCADDDKIAVDILEQCQSQYADDICKIICSGSLPIAIGGGHEIAFGSFMGLHRALALSGSQDKSIGIINLDAHFDLRCDKYATSGTPFLQIADFVAQHNQAFHYLAIGISEFGNTAALFDKAERLGVHIIDENACHELSFDEIKARIDAFIDGVDVLYLTLDLDCLQAGFMPAVSAVNAKGLDVHFVEKCLIHVIQSGKVKIIDIAEFNPNYDIDGRGAKVAARLLAQMAQAFLLEKVK